MTFNAQSISFRLRGWPPGHGTSLLTQSVFTQTGRVVTEGVLARKQIVDAGFFS
jgi:hypothetical protein